MDVIFENKKSAFLISTKNGIFQNALYKISKRFNLIAQYKNYQTNKKQGNKSDEGKWYKNCRDYRGKEKKETVTFNT